jgi:uncharacterized protein involved in exopolysaccharide biosynthesis
MKKKIALRDIAYALFKNKKIIALIFSTSVIAAGCYCLIATPKYKAETKLMVKIGREKFSALEDYSKENFNVLFQERSQNINNEIEILKSQDLSIRVYPRLKEWVDQNTSLKDQNVLNIVRSIVSRVAGAVQKIITAPFEMLGLVNKLTDDQKAMLDFMAALRVDFLEDTDILVLSFTCPNPQFAAFAVNMYASEFLQMRTEVYQQKDSYDFYIDQINLYNKKLDDAEGELQKFLSENAITNIDVQKDLLLRSLDAIEKDHMQAAVRRHQAEALLNEIKRMYAVPDAWVETPDMGSSNVDKQAYLAELDRSYFALKIERDRLLSLYTPRSHEIKKIDTQLNNLRRQKAESLINIFSVDVVNARSKEEILFRDLTEMRLRLVKINENTYTLRKLERAEEISKHTLLSYKKKAEDLRIYDDLDKRKITSVKIINPAVVPLQPVYPKKTLIVGIAAFLGFFLSFGFSAFYEFFNHTFKDAGEVSEELNTPLLLTVHYVYTDLELAEQGKGLSSLLPLLIRGKFKKCLSALQR